MLGDQTLAQVCNTAAAGACEPDLSGGPFDQNPASAQLSDIFQTSWAVHVFSSGTLDHCDADFGMQNWAFTGGAASGAVLVAAGKIHV